MLCLTHLPVPGLTSPAAATTFGYMQGTYMHGIKTHGLACAFLAHVQVREAEEKAAAEFHEMQRSLKERFEASLEAVKKQGEELADKCAGRPRHRLPISSPADPHRLPHPLHPHHSS